METIEMHEVLKKIQKKQPKGCLLKVGCVYQVISSTNKGMILLIEKTKDTKKTNCTYIARIFNPSNNKFSVRNIYIYQKGESIYVKYESRKGKLKYIDTFSKFSYYSSAKINKLKVNTDYKYLYN